MMMFYKCCRWAFLPLQKLRNCAAFPHLKNVLTNAAQKYNYTETQSVNLKYIRKRQFSIAAPLLGFSFLSLFGLEEISKKEESELIVTIKRSILVTRKKEFKKAEQMLHLALRLAQQLQDQLAITYIYDLMANVALESNELDKANKLFVIVMQRLLANGVSEDDLKIVHINLKISRINHLKTDYALAQTGYEWSLEKLDKHQKNPNSNELKLFSIAKNWYGHLLLDGGKPKEALQYLLDSYLLYVDFDDNEDEQIAIQLSDIATVFEKIGDYDSSEKYYLEAIERGKRVKDMEHLAIIYVNLGQLYIKKHLYHQAIKRCGFGWRLGYDNSNKEVQKEARACIDEAEKLSA